MKSIFIIWLTLTSSLLMGQGEAKKVLFLGNSYTSANNLPQMISDVATSVGDTLDWDAEAPGGYYIYDHFVSTTSMNKVAAGNWDYVVLQDQSQATTLPPYQMTFGFNMAFKLDSVINEKNPCAETMFYMTWGRKNGDPFYYQIYSPWYADSSYEFMDSLIQDRYLQMSNDNNAEVSPVGAVWRYVRDNYSNIELYQSDGSHPSISGSYLAACCFYTALYRKDPTLISFNSSLSSSEATIIKNAVKRIVYDNLLNWNIGKYDSVNNVNCLPTNVEIMNKNQNSILKVFPNPAKNKLTLKFEHEIKQEHISIYNASGILIREIEGNSTTLIDINDFPNGIYFIRLKNHPNEAYRFIKN